MSQDETINQENDLFLFNMDSCQIYNHKNIKIGEIELSKSLKKQPCKVYGKNNNLLLSISELISYPNQVFSITNPNENEIIRIKKVFFSRILKFFYIQSPINNQKWFNITKSRGSLYKIKSFATNKNVAEIGSIESDYSLFSDFGFADNKKIYFLKVLDEKIDKFILLASFATIYINDDF